MIVHVTTNELYFNLLAYAVSKNIYFTLTYGSQNCVYISFVLSFFDLFPLSQYNKQIGCTHRQHKRIAQLHRAGTFDPSASIPHQEIDLSAHFPLQLIAWTESQHCRSAGGRRCSLTTLSLAICLCVASAWFPAWRRTPTRGSGWRRLYRRRRVAGVQRGEWKAATAMVGPRRAAAAAVALRSTDRRTSREASRGRRFHFFFFFNCARDEPRRLCNANAGCAPAVQRPDQTLPGIRRQKKQGNMDNPWH